MRHKTLILILILILTFVANARADAQYAVFCHTQQCVKATKYAQKVKKEHHKEVQWKYWTSLYIPSCTWYGESGDFATSGSEFNPYRYTIHNGGWHGNPPTHDGDAYGKYQMMYSTYRHYAKYKDWSRIDQEIAAHRLYWAQGVSPWLAC